MPHLTDSQWHYTMDNWLIENEPTVRMAFFFGSLTIMALWEVIAPCRQLSVSKTLRWVNNLGLVFFNSLLIRAITPTAAVGVAIWAQHEGWGLLNQFELPAIAVLLISVTVMDLVIYGQHVLVHHVPVLWRLHRVHHADPDYDVTTGSRFHPLEIILSMLIKFGTILLLGPSVAAVIVFEVVLNAMAMFNHANIQLPKGIDNFIRKLVVTPDMHRVHHSKVISESNSNFGFNLSIWDRIFGTYKDQPDEGHQGMRIGIGQFNDDKDVVWISGMLTLPFKGK